MSVESHLKASQWQTVIDIEVHTGLCRRQVIRQLNRLVQAGKVERQTNDKISQYRWIQGGQS